MRILQKLEICELYENTYNTYRNKVNINRLDTNGKYKSKPDDKNYVIYGLKGIININVFIRLILL